MENFQISRQRRRKFEKNRYTEKDLQELIDEAIKYGVNYAVSGMSTTVAIVLRDKIGLSKPKTRTALQEISAYFDSIQQGYLTLEDVRSTIEEELGIEFR